MLRVTAANNPIRPLDNVTIDGARGAMLSVRDGEGREYARVPADGRAVVRVSGSLGTHVVFVLDREGRVVDQSSFRVDCMSWIDDEGGRYSKLLDMLFHTMRTWSEGATWIRFNGRYYKYYVRWLRDHVHTLKGMKYFDGEALQSGIDLYADHQQPNGMIWDRIQKYGPHETWRDFTFSYGGFIKKYDRDEWRMERIPVENDVEYLFVEGIYYTWKTTGDDEWMKSVLDNAIKAYEYSMSDPYRWSSKYQLLKRGYTIDTWDFQAAEDAAITGAAMVIDKDKTRFGIMHGDNTGFIAGCRYLAEMLRVAGREEEAAKYATLGEEMQQRLDKLAWNGRFYTHHVPEQEGLVRDLGVDESTQVSLSNAYDINRGVDHDKCVAVIDTYQDIRKRMPQRSPGEFYQIYPPFEKGFGGHNEKWHYMNGGVTTIVAGELAHGAFEHGRERYGADVLNRVLGWGEAHDGYLDCCYRGAEPEVPETTYEPVDIRDEANVDLAGTKGAREGVIGWINEGPNDLSRFPVGRQEFLGIPFEVIDPSSNDRRACLGLASRPGYATEKTINVGTKARSLYFLHTLSNGGFGGWIEVHYADGSHRTQYVNAGKQVGSWFMPKDPVSGGNGKLKTTQVVYRLAWRGANDFFPNVGVYAYGLNNPEPDKEISHLRFVASETGCMWFLLGITASDQPVLLPTNDVSYGIPDNWGSAAVVYALYEGLAGVKDTGRAFDKALLAPRWSAAGVNKATTTAKYEASGGYVRYAYAYDEKAGTATVEVAGNAGTIDFRLLLPQGTSANAVKVNGENVEFTTEKVEQSAYACTKLLGLEAKTVTVEVG